MVASERLTEVTQDPAAQLEMLARRQSDVLASKLSMEGSTREIPDRPLPFGSEGVRSPTYVAPAPPNGSMTSGAGAGAGAGGGSGSSMAKASGSGIEEPSFKGPGALFDKDDGGVPLRAVVPMAPSEEERDVLMT